MAAPLLLPSGPMRCEAGLYGSRMRLACLFYAIVTVFQLYHECDMMYQMTRRNPEPTLLPTQWIFKPPTLPRPGMGGTGL